MIDDGVPEVRVRGLKKASGSTCKPLHTDLDVYRFKSWHRASISRQVIDHRDPSYLLEDELRPSWAELTRFFV